MALGTTHKEQEVRQDLVRLMLDQPHTVHKATVHRYDQSGRCMGAPAFHGSVPNDTPTYRLLCALYDSLESADHKIGFGRVRMPVDRLADKWDEVGSLSKAFGFGDKEDLLTAFQVSTVFETAQDYLKTHIAEATYAKTLAALDLDTATKRRDASAAERSAAWADKFAHDVNVWSKMQPVMTHLETAFVEATRFGLITEKMADRIVATAKQFIEANPGEADWAAPAEGVLRGMETAADRMMASSTNSHAAHRFAQTVYRARTEYDAAKLPEVSQALLARPQNCKESVFAFLPAQSAASLGTPSIA